MLLRLALLINWVSHRITNVSHSRKCNELFFSATFSFPVTGLWKVGLAAAVYKSTSDCRQAEAIIRTFANNGEANSDVAKGPI